MERAAKRTEEIAEIEKIEKRIFEIKNNLRELRYKESKNIEEVLQEDFEEAHKEFEKLEKNGSFYPLFTKLVNQEDKLIAYLFILSTWNFAGFRYLINKFDINKFAKTIDDLEPLFNKFEGKKLRTTNFEDFEKEINEIYNVLSSQVKSVGATKIMHIRKPELFIMWDRRIREYYGLRDDSAQTYIKFLKQMQNKFKNIKVDEEKRTFAKAIDEYNYVKITKPIMNLEKELASLEKLMKKYKNYEKQFRKGMIEVTFAKF